MFKKLAGFFSSVPPQGGGEGEKNSILWKEKVKKVDAAIPRRKILRLHSSLRRKDASDDLSKKDVAKSDPSIRHLKVFMIDQDLHLLYEKEGYFFVKSLDNSGFFKEGRKISIVNNFGYDVSIKNLSGINIDHIDGELILNYRRDDVNERVTAFAVTPNKLVFQEKSVSETIRHKFVFAKKCFSDGKYSAYTGENFIYFASSENLEDWNIQKEHLLTPRQNSFDYCGVKIIETVSIAEGVLLLYESSFIQEGYFYLQIGGALFSGKNPNELLWRSKKHIWEQSYPVEKISNAFPLGALAKDGRIFVYYAISGELMAVDFGIPDFHPEKVKSESVFVERHRKNPIIKPNPKNKWESKAVFNAAAIHAGGKYHLIYRAIGEDDVSSLGYACSDNGFDFDMRLGFPIYVPREKFEGVHGKPYKPCTDPAVYESGGGCSGGCEDPRITRVDDTIYMTYVAYNGHDVPGVAMTSIKYEDFINHRWNWGKARLISKPGQIQKNWVLFPEKINGKYAIIHGLSPKVHIEYVDSLENFGDKGYIESLPPAHGKGYQDPNRKNHWDNIVRGTGAPPIKTKYGWLVFYHAMDKRDPNRYKIGAMILDIDDPEKILYRSRMPILEPDEKYENEGMKAGVIYVCGAIIEKDRLHIYYGGADMVMCVASAKLDDFLERMVADEKTYMEKINL